MFLVLSLLARSGSSTLFADSISEPAELFETPSGTSFLPTDPVPTHEPKDVSLTEMQ
jgi:hypothetical protein